jgi:gliding motility-associated-like protein
MKKFILPILLIFSHLALIGQTTTYSLVSTGGCGTTENCTTNCESNHSYGGDNIKVTSVTFSGATATFTVEKCTPGTFARSTVTGIRANTCDCPVANNLAGSNQTFVSDVPSLVIPAQMPSGFTTGDRTFYVMVQANGTTASPTNLYYRTGMVTIRATTSGGGGSVPAIPTITAITGTNAGEIDLDWNAVSGATYYNLYNQNGVSVPNGSNLTGTSLTRTSLSGQHCYKLEACNAAGCSNLSNASCATARTNSGGGCTTPSTPTSVNAVTGASDGVITLSWSGTANSFDIQYGSTTITATSSPKTITGFTSGSNHCFKVRGNNGATCLSGWSSEDCADAGGSTGSGCTAPSTPTNVNAITGSDGAIALSWSGSANSFNIEVDGVISTSATSSPKTITGFASGSNHCFRVRGNNGATCISGWSDEDCADAGQSAVTQYNVSLPPPTGGTAVGSGTYNQNTNATVDAYPSTGYSFLGWYENTTLMSTTSSYTFRVTRNITLLAKFDAIPNAPTLTASFVEPTGIDLSWTSVTGATKYKLYKGDGTPIDDNIAANTLTYPIRNLSINQQYCYKIRSCKNDNCSNFSNTVCQQTQLEYVDIGMLRLSATAIENIGNRKYVLTGNGRIGLKSSWPNGRSFKLSGAMTADLLEGSFEGTGTIALERGQRNGSDLLFFNSNGTNFKFTVAQALSKLINTNAVSNVLKLAGITLKIDKYETLTDGLNIEGDMKLPDIVKAFDTNQSLDAHITRVELKQNEGIKAAGSVALSKLSIGTGLSLENTNISFDAINDVYKGGTTLKTALFRVDGNMRFQSGALQDIGVTYTPARPIILGTTGLSVSSLGGGVSNLMNATKPINLYLNGSLVPTTTAPFNTTGLELDIKANYEFGTSFNASGSLKLFNKSFANAGFTISGLNEAVAETEVRGDVDFCIMDAAIKVKVANNKIAGNFDANFKTPSQDCLRGLRGVSYYTPDWIKPYLDRLAVGQKLATTKNYLRDKYIAGYASLNYKLGGSDINLLELYYAISSSSINYGMNYTDIPIDFRNNFTANPFTPARVQRNTWYAYNVNAATQSLIIEAHGGSRDVPAFWIKTPTGDTITAQNVVNKPFVTYSENPTTHYAAYYFRSPKNGDFFIGVVDADSIKVNSALVRPSIQITDIQHNINAKKFTLNWQDECPDRDALISLGYDTDTEGGGILFADSISQNSAVNRYTWNYTDKLKAGKYYFYATIQDSVGLFRTVYFNTPFTVLADNVVTAPSNLVCSVEQDAVRLHWNGNNPYPITYIVYYSDKPNTVNNRSANFAVVNDTFFGLDKFIAGRYYEFMVTALDTFGKESAYSNITSLTYRSTLSNNVPFITTVKDKDITYLGGQYVSTIAAQDLDNQPLTYTLVESPSGMQIHSTTGQINWQPQRNENHFGYNNVKVKVADTAGGTDSIAYQVYALDTSAATATAQFNKALYLGYDDKASVFIRDDDFGGNKVLADSFAIQVFSTADPIGFSTYAHEIGLNSGEFVVNFSFDSLMTRNGKIKTNLGDTIWVAFTDASMNTNVIAFSYFTKVKANFEQPTFICSGDSFRFKNLSTGSGVKYEWDFNDGTFSYSKHPMHTFQPIYGGVNRIFNVKLTITDEDGRSSFIHKAVTIIPLPVANFGDTVKVCDRITLDAGNPNGNYLWSNGDTTRRVTFSNSQILSVKITNEYGCVNSDTTNLTIWKVKALINSTIPNSCHTVNRTTACDGRATVNILEGGGNYRFAWSAGQNIQNPNNLCVGNHQLIVTDANNCHDTLSTMIGQADSLKTAFISTIPESCDGRDGRTIISTIGGTPQYNYRWSNNETTYAPTGLARGANQVTVTDIRGCTQVAQVSIPFNDQLKIDTIRQTALPCFGDRTATATAITSGASNMTYVWSNGGRTAAISGLNVGAYTVTVTTPAGCSRTKSVTITQPTQLSIDSILKNASPCIPKSGTAHAFVSGGVAPYRYDWSSGQALPIAVNLVSNNYVVTVTDANNCRTSQTVSMTVMPELLATTTTTMVRCFGEKNGSASVINVSGGNGAPYRYSMDGINFGTQSRFDSLLAGAYTMTIQDVNGCKSIRSAIVQQPAKIDVDLDNVVKILLGDSVQVFPRTTARPEFKVSISPKYNVSCDTCMNAFVKPYQKTIYTVTVQDPRNGCVNSDSMTVFVENKGEIFVPNSFSPNNDGWNDYFAPYGGRNVKRVIKMAIFARNGSEIFRAENIASNDESQGWDGKFKGSDMTVGTYIYVIEIEFFDGTTKIFTGDINLLR